MKTAAVVLGIIGGALDALFGLFIMIFGGIAAQAVLGAGLPGMEGMQSPEFTGSMITGVFIIAGILVLLVAALGIVGGVVSKKSPTVGGILMLVAGLLNFFGGWPGFLVGAMLVVGGVLSLVAAGEAKKAARPAPEA